MQAKSSYLTVVGILDDKPHRARLYAEKLRSFGVEVFVSSKSVDFLLHPVKLMVCMSGPSLKKAELGALQFERSYEQLFLITEEIDDLEKFADLPLVAGISRNLTNMQEVITRIKKLLVI